MPGTNSSAEGGRSGWQGLRFEAAFAVLNLVRTAKGAPPVGLDENSTSRADSGLGLDIRFKPQASGAVDDLVALGGATGRVIAYQAKSGLGRVPTGRELTSTTARALEQAARELRDPDGARVVGLAFGQLSNPMRVIARWLRAEPDALTPPPRHLAAIATALREDTEHVDWDAIRPRLRLLEMGGVAEIGALIELELASVYASPADRVSAADALREMVATHSDIAGASLPPIDRYSMNAWLAQRRLMSIGAQEVRERSVSILARAVSRFFEAVQRDRGSLPEIERHSAVDGVCSALASRDVVLVGSGGSGKTEIECQVIRRHLSEGWVPIIVSRAEIARAGAEFGRELGIGGRTGLADVARDIVTAEGQMALIVIDGLDELRRIGGAARDESARGLLQVLNALRLHEAGQGRVRVLVTCRTYDWERLADSATKLRFTAVPTGPVLDTEVTALGTDTECAAFVSGIRDPLRTIVLSRPILLRLAFELWVKRSDQLGGRDAHINEIASEVALWRAYYEEVVCAPDVGLSSAIEPGDVRKCHEQVTRAQVQRGAFSLLVNAEPIERNNPRAYPWLRSVDVVSHSQSPNSRLVRFFHPTYADFALSQLLAQEEELATEWLHTAELAVPLYPVWKRLPAFLVADEAPSASDRLCRDLQDTGAGYLAKRALIEGVIAVGGDGRTLCSVAEALLTDPELLKEFVELAIARAARTSEIEQARPWVEFLASKRESVPPVVVDELLRDLQPFVAEPRVPEWLRSTCGTIITTAFVHAVACGKTAAGLPNAMVLIRNAIAVERSLLSPEFIRTAPIAAVDWHDVGDTSRATMLAAETRSQLTGDDVVLAMHTVSPTICAEFLIRVLAGLPEAADESVGLGHPQQTGLNFNLRLIDLWTMSWHRVASVISELLARDVRAYARVGIAAWMFVGEAWRAEHGDAEREFPARGPEHWLHDASYYWWGPDTIGLRCHEHTAIAQALFGYMLQRLSEGSADALDIVVGAALEVRWAGLIAVVLETVAEFLRTADAANQARRASAEVVAGLLEWPGTFNLQETRYSIGEVLPVLLPVLEEASRDRLWPPLRSLVDPARIAAEPVQPPVLEDLKREREEELKRAAAISGGGGPLTVREALLAAFRASPVEAQYERELAIYERRAKIRDEALNGRTPLGHPDVAWVLSVLRACDESEARLLIPGDLAALLARARGELPGGIARVEPPIRIAHHVETIAPPSTEGVQDPRLLFVWDVEERFSRHLNRRDPWSAEEAGEFSRRVEDTRSLAGLDEPTPIAVPKSSFEDRSWRRDQPYPKRAWLRLVVLYLEHLPTGSGHGLAHESVRSVLLLASDIDPATQRAASSVVPSTVRGLAAEALALIRYFDGPREAAVAVGKLATDENAEVRHSVYTRAAVLRRIDPDVFARVLNQLCARESDPYLLETWGPRHLFRGAPMDQERPVWDRASAELLRRCLGAGEVAIPLEVAKEHHFAERVAEVGVYMAVTGAPDSAQAIRDAITTPVTGRIVPELGWCIAERLIHELDAEARRGAALDLLNGFGARARAASRLAPSELGPEAAAATQIAEVVGAALLGEEAMPWAAPMRTREEDLRPNISAGVRACAEQLRATWRAAVEPWLQSELVPGLQRMLHHALRVANVLLRDRPQEAAELVLNWNLAECASALERPIMVEITGFLRAAVTDPNASWSRGQYIAFMRLLDALVKTGYDDARGLALYLAERAREGPG